MNRNLIIIILVLFGVILEGCTGARRPSRRVSKTRQTAEDFADLYMPENELRETTDKAIKLILEKDYEGVKSLFVPIIADNTPDTDYKMMVDMVYGVIDRDGVPSGNDIIPMLTQFKVNGKTEYMNHLSYNYQSLSGSDKSKPISIVFSFLEVYGSDKLVAINVQTQSNIDNNLPLTIDPLDSFDFDLKKMKTYRIYYDEGKDKITQFGKNKGVFAINGSGEKMIESGLNTVYSTLLNQLKKIDPPIPQEFRGFLDRGESTRFIQTEMYFVGSEYTLFVFLPIEDGGKYEGKIVIIQKEFANLGHMYLLNQTDHPELVETLTKIPDMNLEGYYEERP